MRFTRGTARTLALLLPIALLWGCAFEAAPVGRSDALRRDGLPRPPIDNLPAQPGTPLPEPPGPPPYAPDPTDPRACSERTYLDLWDPAIAAVRIDCNLRLPPGFETGSRLVVRGGTSDIVIECNGARFHGGPHTLNAGRDMIAIHSVRTGDTWARPENITVRGCQVTGSVRVWGMAPDGNDKGRLGLHQSSHLGPGAAHTQRVRDAAPRRIVFEDMHITGDERIPLYVAPGVTELTMRESTIDGEGSSVAVYLDAESGYNTLVHNTIEMRSERELLAIDGSSHNRIVDNYFSALYAGGIYLYRNCGEGGTIRVTTPSHNYIVDNVFYYRDFTGLDPAIYLGSRGGDPPGFELFGFSTYCNDEDGRSWGSSASDRDHATDNVVMANQIIGRSVAHMIRFRDPPSRFSENYVALNASVPSASDVTERHAGCYVPFLSYYFAADRGDLAGDFVPHGGTHDAPPLACRSRAYRCDEGRLACDVGPLPSSSVRPIRASRP